MQRWVGRAAAAAAVGFAAILLASTGPAIADDRPPLISDDSHAGYYYPELTSREVYVSRANQLKDATRATRLGFVTNLTQQQLSKGFAPTFAIFAKGNDAEKLIIMSLGDQGFRSIYQARGILAQLTAVARSTRLLREMQVDDVFNFFDLARLLGFTQITISDGETFSHQVDLQ